MAKSTGIRVRLLTILILAVLVSALSLTALVHLLSTTTRQRVERAHDAVSLELERLAHNPGALRNEPSSSLVGLRAGVWPEMPNTPAPESWRPAIERALSEARLKGNGDVHVALGDSTLVVSARPLAAERYVWAGFLVRPLASLTTWQWIVTLLALATCVLVATSVYSIVTVQRGAAELRRSLQELAVDLSAPVPRPKVRELASVADGIDRLARALLAAGRERQRLQSELAKRERLSALGRVAAGVAHEVRNPLASIKLRLDLASAGRALPADVEQAIAHATTEIGRLDRLVADLLIVAGRAPGSRSSIALGALVRSRIDVLEPWAKERDVALSVNGDAEVTADRDALARAVDNLLRNAVEASAPGQRVSVGVEARGQQARIAVQDAGSGVPAEHLRGLFEPFFTTKPDGTGLGLALSRAIARAHGGDLQYVRDDGVTRFELTLPERAESEAPEAPSSSSAEPRLDLS